MTNMDKDIEYSCNKCYFLSRLADEEGRPVRGQSKRMHSIWKERYGTEITEQHLCDQASVIRQNEWITELELENISRKAFRDIEADNNDNTSERFYQDEENILENEATQVDTEFRRGVEDHDPGYIRFNERQQWNRTKRV